MCFGIDLAQLRNRIVGIDLRRLQRGVSHQLLDLAHVGTTVHEVSGKGVAQHMGALFPLHTGLAEHPINQSVNPRPLDATTSDG